MFNNALKDRRTTAWWGFIISLIMILVFLYIEQSRAAAIASMATAAVSLVLALFVYKAKTREQVIGRLRVDPILILLIVWLLVSMALR